MLDELGATFKGLISIFQASEVELHLHNNQKVQGIDVELAFYYFAAYQLKL